MTRKIPPADRSWSKDAKELWRAVHSGYSLETHHVVLLRQAAELVTRADQARRQLAESGLVTTDRYGGAKVSPLVEVERSSVNTARLVLRELGLDLDGGVPEERVRLHRAVGYDQ
jgi:hypothetical protein